MLPLDTIWQIIHSSSLRLKRIKFETADVKFFVNHPKACCNGKNFMHNSKTSNGMSFNFGFAHFKSMTSNW